MTLEFRPIEGSSKASYVSFQETIYQQSASKIY